MRNNSAMFGFKVFVNLSITLPLHRILSKLALSTEQGGCDVNGVADKDSKHIQALQSLRIFTFSNRPTYLGMHADGQ